MATTVSMFGSEREERWLMYLDGKIGGIWRNKRSNVFVLSLLTHLGGEEDVALIAGSAPRLKSLIVQYFKGGILRY